ncbi:MAG: ATP-binding protein [Candidatus Ozemobacteraceae bacterium]
MKKLPIGISTFSKIREDGYCYADKTRFIAQLATNGTYFFLSRPRRFGKSLFIDTLKEAFSCNKKLFEGLALEKNWNWEKPSPVISISFGGGVIKNREELDKKIHSLLDDQFQKFEEQNQKELISDRFADLIQKMHFQAGATVTVLIDEYDKPILDNITAPDIAREIREGLKNFYSVIKDSDAHVRFCFLTGVSKFSKVSLFSGLNNLQDISLDSRYSTLCGYTQHELETVFSEHLPGVDLVELKRWYDGYNFDGESIYNPYDILLYLDKREFKNYWFETGTPTFLIDLLGRRHFLSPDLENLLAGDALLGSFDVDQIEPETLLFQTGYLTIKEKQQIGGAIMYELAFPNLEVKMSLTDHILANLSGAPAVKDKTRSALFKALMQGAPEGFRPIFHSFFASIPHDWYRKNELSGYEGYYASIFYCYFTALGLEVIAEDTTNKGRLDMRVTLGNRIYIFEFKVVELTPAGLPLAQLKNKRYHEKYVTQGSEIFLIGIEFSKVDRNIVSFEYEKIGTV